MERCNRGHNLKGLEDPEVGSIVQADSPEKPLSSITFNGLGHSSGTSLYWTSMLKLMEEAAPVFSVTHSMDNIMPDASTGHSHPQPMEKSTPPPSSSSPSSSSVHDQPLDMMVYYNGIHSTDPDSSVWTEEFLNGSISESKTCHVGDQPDTCSDDGLHELLYPRTVLELLLSDEPKCDQIPYSWSDIIQHTLSGNPNKPNFGSHVTLDKPTGDHNYDTANSQTTQVADIRLPQYFQNFSRFSCTDDRLSSSTASSTLSDCTTDQWAPAITSGSHYEHSQTQPSARHQNASFTNVQQVDRRRISAALFRSIENGNGIPSPHLQQNLHEQKAMMNATSQMGFRNTDLTNDDYEEKPVLGNNICCDAQINANDRISHHHQQHIYESNTAATYSNNLKHSHRLSQIQCKPEPAFGTHNGVTYTHGVASSIRGYNTQAQSQQHQRQYQPYQKIYHGTKQGCGRPIMRESLMGGDTDMNGNQSIFAPFQTCNTMTPISNVKALCKAGATMESMKRSKVAPSMSNNEKQESQNQHCATEYQFKRLQKDQGSSSPQSASTTSTLLKTEPAHKVKFSERVSTLQQLVSPYGKTDTASVLQEAIGYIKFLHDQVQQALSIPYLKSPTNHNGDHCNDQNEEKIDLKSRGLCLVPISCTIQVSNDNGADYWYSGSIR